MIGQKNDKNIVISMSLLMRMFEWCHESANNDVAMHKAMEKIISFNDGINPLTIDVYDLIIANANDGQESEDEMTSDEGLETAYDIGANDALNGEYIDAQGDDYSHIAGEKIMASKGNGYGASNAEIEQFWNGYNDNKEVDEIVSKPVAGFKYLNINDFLNKQPNGTQVISLNGEEPCCQEVNQPLSDDMLKQIDEIIRLGR